MKEAFQLVSFYSVLFYFPVTVYWAQGGTEGVNNPIYHTATETPKCLFTFHSATL